MSYRPETMQSRSGLTGSRNSRKYSSLDDPHEKRPPSSRMIESRAAQNSRRSNSKKQKRAPIQIIEHLDMSNYTHQTNTVVDMDEPLFQPYPSEVKFEDFEPFITYELTIYFRNNDNVARRVKVVPPSEPFLTIQPLKSPGNATGKVAPGMEVAYLLKFLPEEKKDYSYDVVVITEREKFILPVRASGGVACLDFPDEIEFGICPPRHPSTMTFNIRNIGTKESRFTLDTQRPFSVFPIDGNLGIHETMQVTVTFHAQSSHDAEGEIVIEYETGERVYSRVRGTARDVDLNLSLSEIELESTFITLDTKKTFTLENNSEIVAKFQWKMFESEKEEEDFRLSRDLQLAQVEAEELNELGHDEDDDGDEDRDGEKALVHRRFRELRKANEEDALLFDNDMFFIEPIEGEIWPNSKITFTATFRPQASLMYSCTSYLQVAGKEERAPLSLRGQGIGPQVVFNQDVVDLGDVFVNLNHKLEICLQNCGQIQARYQLEPSNTLFSTKFAISPETGIVGVGEEQLIEVNFLSDILGEFSEHFSWLVQGSPERLWLHFKGRVMGPTFSFDVEEVDFGVTSYGFLNTKLLHLENTSEIPMRFNLRIPADGNFLQREFDIVPAQGTILPHGKQKIQLDFIPTILKTYDVNLVVDVENVGEDLLSLPLRAECIVPDIDISESVIEYGECFLNYPYKKTISLINNTDLPAKYKVAAQEAPTKTIAIFECDQPKGTIQPQSTLTLTVTFCSKSIGPITLPMYISIVGGVGEPLQTTIVGSGIGPQVKADKMVVDFGKIAVLQHVKKQIKITNNSLIPANFESFVKKTDSNFHVDIPRGVMKPNESIVLTVTAYLDEIQKFTDELYILVQDGRELLINLVGRGIGTTIYCAEDIKALDMGFRFTNRIFTHEIILQNKGRKPQSLTWVNETEKKREMDKKRQEKEGSSKDKKDKVVKKTEETLACFRFEPERFTLQPKTACVFILRGLSSKVQTTTERLLLKASTGGNKPHTIYETDITAEFGNPLLEFSAAQLSFQYVYEPEVPILPHTQPVTLKNIAQLPISFVPRISAPFRVDSSEITLQPDESVTINVNFDPAFKKDRQTRKVKNKLTIHYRDHPQKDTLDVLGSVMFPNLTFDTPELNFGCILNDTVKRIYVNVTNVTEIDAVCRWSFVDDDNPKKTANSTNKVFDILPVHCVIKGGQTERVEFVYYGYANRRFRTTATCEVIGGPDYKLPVMGDANLIQFKLDKDNIDFGVQLFDIDSEREMWLTNNGKVDFEFTINTATISGPSSVTVSPMEGKIKGDDKQKIMVKFCPGVPEVIDEYFLIQIDPFEPVKVHVTGQGTYPNVAVALPRNDMDLPIVKQALELTKPLRSGMNSRATTASGGTRPPRPMSRESGGDAFLPPPTAASPPPPADGSAPAAATAGNSRPQSRQTTFDAASVARSQQGGARPSTGLSLHTSTSLVNARNNLEADSEVNRLKLKEIIKDKTVEELITSRPGSRMSRQSVPSEQASSIPSSAIVAKKKKRPATSSIHCGKYQLDFGNVIRGTVVEKKFYIQNFGFYPASFDFNKSELGAHGLTIEPDRVSRLPGPPENEMQEFNLQLQTQNKNLQLGPIDVDIPIKVKMGPITTINVTGHLTVPDLDVSRDVLDFGEVICERARVMVVQLVNNGRVACNWSLPSSIVNKDWRAFQVTPRTGTLSPGDRVNVDFIFNPTEDRKYQVKVPIKIAQNPKPHIITCKGVGVPIDIEFDPPVLDMGAVLPRDTVEEMEVKLINKMDIDVEVYSIDFDDQYVQEEAVLREQAYGESGTLWMQPRQPGDPLPQEMVDIWQEAERRRAEEERLRLEAEEAERLEQERLEAENNPPSGSATQRTGGSKSVKTTEDKTSVAPKGGETEVGTLEPEDTPRTVIEKKTLIVMGPPLSGKTTVSRDLSSLLQLPVVSVDEMIESCQMPQPVPTGDEPLETSRSKKTVSEKSKSEKSGDKEGEEEPEEEPVKLEVSELGQKVAAWINERQEEEIEEGVKVWPNMPHDMLKEVIASFVNSPAFETGIVIDGTDCSYVTHDWVIFALREVSEKTTYVRELQISEEEMNARCDQIIDSARHSAMSEVGVFPEVEERVYDEMDEMEQEAYIAERTAHRSAVAKKKRQIDKFARELRARVGAGWTAYQKTENIVHLFEPLTEEELAAQAPPDPKAKGGKKDAAPAKGGKGGKNAKSFYVPPPLPDRPEDLATRINTRSLTGESASDEVAQEVAKEFLPPEEPPESLYSLAIPDPVTHQVVPYPPERGEREPNDKFVIVPQEPPVSEADAAAAQAAAAAEKDAKGGKGGKGGKKGGKEDEAKSPEPEESTPNFPGYRWSLGPKEEKVVKIKFSSKFTGSFDKLLRFEVVGCSRSFALMCKGTCQYPRISADYRNVFYNKVKTKPDNVIISKKYVINQGLFDFGPLLVGKPPAEEGQPNDSEERFRITNNGLFDLHVDFWLANLDESAAPYSFEPKSMDLARDETQEVVVTANPKEVGQFDNALVCTIHNNPDPVAFKLTCAGSKPEVELLESDLAFERLLLHRRETKFLRFRNPTLLPVAWKLTGLEAVGTEFEVSHKEGVLEPNGECGIGFTFNAEEPNIYKYDLKLEVSDYQELLGVEQSLPLTLSAEAYSITVDVKFANGPDSGLDYGVVRVHEEPSQKFEVINQGKYNIGFKFIQRKNIGDLFTVTPMEGELQPGKSQVVEVQFKPGDEVNLSANTDIRCQVSEVLTDEVIATLPIKVSARAVFSKYRILPARGIIFGPLVYNTSKTRTFDVTNNGEFPFNVTLSQYVEGGGEEDVATSASKTPEPGKGGKKTPDPKKDKKGGGGGGGAKGGNLQLGQFTITPSSGTVDPGSSITISVDYKAEGNQPHRETLAIDISERDPNDSPGGLAYDLSGESCIPGISTDDTTSIFEEQEVVHRLEHSSPLRTVFAEEERTFNFASVIVGQTGSHRIKMSNPGKVPCDVKFSIKPRGGGAAKGGDKGGADAFPFEILPEKWHIPTHEHRFVTVYFKPKSMQSYQGVFEAVVEGGTDPKTNKLNFEVGGAGTLPHLSVSEPADLTEDGQRLCKFRRLLVGKSQTLPLTLTNEGILPATVRFTMESSPAFTFSGRGMAFTIESGATRSFSCSFNPPDVGTFSTKISMNISQNQFEDTTIVLEGESYMEDVTFDGLNEDKVGELSFGDCTVGEAKQVVFSISNNSQKHMRFEWSDHENVSFTPKLGHLHAGKSKTVKATFKSEEPTTLEVDSCVIPLNLQPIEYEEGPEDWDDRMKTVKWIQVDPNAPPEGEGEGEGEGEPDKAVGDTASGGKSTLSPPPGEAEDGRLATSRSSGSKRLISKKVVEVDPEPAYQFVGGPEEADVEAQKGVSNLKVEAKSNFASFECDTTQITFKKTFMFQSRTFTFPLVNTSNVGIHYNWNIVDTSRVYLDEGPFSVEPQNGLLAAGATQNVVVKFAPIDVEDYRRVLVCDIPHLQEGEAPSIPLKGSSARPVCHFELPDSDYITGGRRDGDLPSLDHLVGPTEQVRVFEFESLGTKVRNTKRFYVVNPTNASYEFMWTCDDDEGASHSVFRCQSTKGLVQSGKKFEMVFEFIPEQQQLVESVWRFQIPDYNINVPFLLVGTVLEPNVSLSKPHVNFKQILVGARAKDTIYIINKEHIPFQFAFDKDAYTTQPTTLSLNPPSGVVGPDSQMAIEMTFTPTVEKSFNFNINCNIKKKATRLAVNVKGEGYAVHDTITVEDADRRQQYLKTGTTNFVDFGLVHVNERRVKTITIANSGKFNFDYTFEMQSNRFVTISPIAGTVSKGEKSTVEVTYLPVREGALNNITATCMVSGRHKYTMAFGGQGKRPNLNFSFTSWDFGPRFLHTRGTKPVEALLHVSNNDLHEIGYDILFENKPHLEVHGQASVLAPGESTDIPILFMPRELASYSEVIPFEINGLVTVPVNITGEGTQLKLELADHVQENVNFGALRLGQQSTKQVKIVNKSRSHLTFDISRSREELAKHQVALSPTHPVTLRPKEATVIEAFFAPNHRSQPFSVEVQYQLEDQPLISRPLFTVEGSCIGMELKFESDTMTFGAVALNSTVTRRLLLENSGDIGVKFQWDPSFLSPDFSVKPVEGYIHAHEDVTFDVTFHPPKLDKDIRYERIPVYVEGMDPLSVTFAGMCVEQPPEQEVLAFSTNVRQTQSKTITLKNPTNVHWHILPSIDNDNWQGPEVIDVPVGGTASYELTYHPLSMTSAETKHSGFIFFPRPDGQAILYTLTGEATEPKQEGAVAEELPAKVNKEVSLAVPNWLKKPQRFKVTIERGNQDDATILKGLDYIDVPALMSRNYKLNFYAYKETNCSGRVTFTNDETGEYVFYTFNFKATAAQVLDELLMETKVRQNVKIQVPIENPLDKEVTFMWKVDSDVVFTPDTTVLPAKTEKMFDIEFRPLLIGETKSRLTINAPELGAYLFDLKLAALPAGKEKVMHFNVDLGNSQTQAFRFLNFVKAKTTYTAEVGDKNSGFITEGKTDAAGNDSGEGAEASIDVTFEPSALGPFSDKLIVKSAQGGEYVCALVGECVPPKPQGPLVIKSGASGSFNFKNILNDAKLFTFRVDNPAFTVKPNENIPSKKAVGISIAYKPQPGQEGPLTGKLTITTDDMPPWICYLKGE